MIFYKDYYLVTSWHDTKDTTRGFVTSKKQRTELQRQETINTNINNIA